MTQTSPATADRPDSGTGPPSDRAPAERSSRRAILAAGGALAATTLAGCLGGTDTEDGGDGDGDGGTDATPTDTATDAGGTTTTAGPTDYPDEVVIGSIHPFTGSTSYTGTRTHQAIDLAATIANEDGGIESMDGADVRVLKRDHKNDPSLGAEAVQELVNEGADILTGTYSSAVTTAAATAAEGQGVPFVIDVSTAASILQERDFDYVYRTQPNSLEMGANTVDHTLAAAEDAGLDASTAGLFYIDVTYGQSIRDGLRAGVEGGDLEIVAEETIGYGGTADTQVTALRQADPDVLFPTVFPTQFMELIGAMQDQDYWPRIFSGAASAGFTKDNFQKIGQIINGSLSTGFRLDPSKSRVPELSQRFAQTYETAPMESNQGMAYATAEVMIEAFEAAATTEHEPLNTTLQEITVEEHVMAMPPITFRADGENDNAIAVTNQIQDFATSLVYPEQFAVAEVNTETLVKES